MTSQEKCFALTGAFEGRGYRSLSGSFDGQGISFGFLQWNLGQGTLQPLLKAMHKAGPKTFQRCCTVWVSSKDTERLLDLSGDLLQVAGRTPADAVAWAEQRQDEGDRLLPHWVQVFYNLADEPGFQAIQRQFAKPYMDKAIAYAQTFNFQSERGLALLFDICVQMGSITAPSRQRYQATAKGDEADRLLAMAHAVTPQAGKRWARDVLSRKRTIALGKGVVHGMPYHLERDFGISLKPWRMS